MKTLGKIVGLLTLVVLVSGWGRFGEVTATKEWRLGDIRAAVDSVVATKVQPILDIASAVAPGGFEFQDELLVRHALSFLLADIAQDLVYGAGMDPDTAVETAYVMLLSLAAAVADGYQAETGEVLPFPNSKALFPDEDAQRANMGAKLAERGLTWAQVADEARATVRREASRLASIAGEIMGEEVDMNDPDITRIMGYVETTVIRMAATIAANSDVSPGRAADLALNVLYDLPNLPAPLAFAAPKYRHLEKEANAKALEGVHAAGISTVTLEYSRALLEGADPCQWSWEEPGYQLGDFTVSINARLDRQKGEQATSVTVTHYNGTPIGETKFSTLKAENYTKTFTLDICME